MTNTFYNSHLNNNAAGGFTNTGKPRPLVNERKHVQDKFSGRKGQKVIRTALNKNQFEDEILKKGNYKPINGKDKHGDDQFETTEFINGRNNLRGTSENPDEQKIYDSGTRKMKFSFSVRKDKKGIEEIHHFGEITEMETPMELDFSGPN